LKLLTTASQKNSRDVKLPEFVHVPFKGSEIYLLHKAFVGAGGAFNENYKALSKRLYPNF
jgi:hypothetical protein